MPEQGKYLSYKAPVYRLLAQFLEAHYSAKNAGRQDWADKHWETVEKIVDNELPSGSGIDNGIKIDPASNQHRIILVTAYHHMDESGGYSKWTEHSIYITASLAHKYEMHITGPNENDIKEYLAETIGYALDQEV